ncbi:MAG TPA: nucleotide exchange factor GrpE [Streptosporangiaceae bacterium]
MSEQGKSTEPGPEPAPGPVATPFGEPGSGSGPQPGGAGSRPEPDGAGVDEDSSTAATAVAEAAAARIAWLEDQRLRALADLDNLRKRCASQVSSARAETRAEVARHWLPVIDNLERALAHAQADPGSIIEGVRAVRDQAESILAGLGFPRRDDLGARFDPARHEAVASRPDPQAPDGSVVEVVLPGYGDGSGQLRPAQVVVSRAD